MPPAVFQFSPLVPIAGLGEEGDFCPFLPRRGPYLDFFSKDLLKKKQIICVESKCFIFLQKIIRRSLIRHHLYGLDVDEIGVENYVRIHFFRR